MPHADPTDPEPPSLTGDCVLACAQVRCVDRIAIEHYGMPGIVLMENAARAVALATESLAASPSGQIALIVCGSGNNGGDGWAAARHLHNRGRLRPVVMSLGEPRAGSDAAINADIVRRMPIQVIGAAEREGWRDVGVVVDALFGTGLARPVTGEAADVIEWINGLGKPVLAVDIPSGLDGDRGEPLGVAVRSMHTVTFVAPKPGLLTATGRSFAGTVTVADIGAPVEIVRDVERGAACSAGPTGDTPAED